MIEFALTPIMHRSREDIVNQFKQNVDLMAQINYDNSRIRDSTYAITLMLSNMYFDADDPIRKDIQDGFLMKADCVAEYGKEQRDAGKIEMVIDLLNKDKLTIEDAIGELVSLNCDLETISDVTGLSVSEID